MLELDSFFQEVFTVTVWLWSIYMLCWNVMSIKTTLWNKKSSHVKLHLCHTNTSSPVRSLHSQSRPQVRSSTDLWASSKSQELTVWNDGRQTQDSVCRPGSDLKRSALSLWGTRRWSFQNKTQEGNRGMKADGTTTNRVNFQTHRVHEESDDNRPEQTDIQTSFFLIFYFQLSPKKSVREWASSGDYHTPKKLMSCFKLF